MASDGIAVAPIDPPMETSCLIIYSSLFTTVVGCNKTKTISKENTTHANKTEEKSIAQRISHIFYNNVPDNSHPNKV